MKFLNLVKADQLLKRLLALFIIIFPWTNPVFSQATKHAVRAVVNEGILEGELLENGIQVFRGIPYASPPVGNLRWQSPQPSPCWNGIRKAVSFGPRPFQNSGLLYEFRSESMSEDCLYLNIWSMHTPSANSKPVYVFIHGGSFIHGDGSQVAYDGESMAKQGVIYISINYRLGIFGFLAHPDLSKESPVSASGNYGLLDQLAALKWIKANVSAFGGDPNRITIGGESVGAQSVSGHMASRLSTGFFNAAIAQSSSFLDSRKLLDSKASAEGLGVEYFKKAKVGSLFQLRSLTPKRLLKLASNGDPRRFKPNIDGYFFDESPLNVFEQGRQAKVPLIVGWNADEVPAITFYKLSKANPANFYKKTQEIYGDNAKALLAYYPVKTKKEAKTAGSRLASEWLINFGSWQLAELHAASDDAPTYRYLFSHPHPGLVEKAIKKGGFLEVLLKKFIQKTIKGTAFHAAEIEYALGNLDAQQNYAWKDEDYIVSKQMQFYFTNFIKTGNPNGIINSSYINWPRVQTGQAVKFLNLGLENKLEIEDERNRSRFLLLRRIGVAD